MFRKTTAVVSVAALAAALTYTLTSSASTPRLRDTYQGRTAQQWHRLAVQRRVQRDHARTLAGQAIRHTRYLQASMVRARARHRPDVAYAIRLAATVYGVSQSELDAVASCESHHYPFAQNGQYRGVFQEGPMFERGLFGRAGFSVWDPIANTLTAAETVSREGWSQWSCKP